MTTQIFATYEEFTERKDKTVNGVSPEFAKTCPNWESMNETNTGCWCCYDCNDCNDCYRCNYCNYCIDCNYCYRCYRCNHCKNCNYCNRCNRCIDYHGVTGAKE